MRDVDDGMDRTRLYRLAWLAIPLVLGGCRSMMEDDPAGGLVAVIVGSVLVILLVGSLGCSLYTAMIVGGAINAKINFTSPTPRSRRWGWVFAIGNLLNGVLGVAFIVVLATGPSDSEEPMGADAWLYVITATGAALAVGVAGLVGTVRGRKRETWEDPSGPPTAF
jgi:hypothetical protein